MDGKGWQWLAVVIMLLACGGHLERCCDWPLTAQQQGLARTHSCTQGRAGARLVSLSGLMWQKGCLGTGAPTRIISYVALGCDDAGPRNKPVG